MIMDTGHPIFRPSLFFKSSRLDLPFENQADFQMVQPFENPTSKSLVFIFIHYSDVWYSDVH
jgi:hypothetical protein